MVSTLPQPCPCRFIIQIRQVSHRNVLRQAWWKWWIPCEKIGKRPSVVPGQRVLSIFPQPFNDANGVEAWSTSLESTLWKGGHEHFAKVPLKRELGSSGIGILIWNNIGKTLGSYWDLESIRLGNYTQGFKLPCAVDDNKEVIQDCANRQVHTAHIKVRRKPCCDEAEVVKNFRLDTAEPVKRLFEGYRWGVKRWH